MLSVSVCRCDSTASNSVFDTNVEVNRLDNEAEEQRGRKPADRPGPELEQERRTDERREVRVHQGQKHAREAGVDRRAHAAPGLHLLLDALEDEHVRVHAHPHREHEPRDARQRHRRAEVGHRAEQDDQVADQRDDRVDAGQPVEDEHEHRDQGETDRRRQHARVDRVLAERRPDRRLLHVGQRSRQRAGPEFQRQVLGLLHREGPGDLALIADGALDVRRRHDRPVEDDREKTVDVLAGRLAEPGRRVALHLEVHGRLVVLVRPLLRAPQVAPRQDRHLADEVVDRLRRRRTSLRAVLDAGEHFGPGRLLAAGGLQQALARRRRPLLHQLQLELRRGLDDRLGPIDVGDAGQLNQEVVLLGPLLRDDRLGHAQLVDSALDGHPRLHDGGDLHVTGDVRLHRERVAPGARLPIEQRLQVHGRLPEDRVLRRLEAGHLELRRAEDGDGDAGHAGRFQRLSEPLAAVHRFQLERLFGIDAEDEMDAALEVEAQPDLLLRRDDRPQARADDDDDEGYAPA